MGAWDTVKKVGKHMALGGVGSNIADFAQAESKEWSKPEPVRQEIGIDPETEALINKQKEEAMKSPEQVAGELATGIEAPSGIIKAPIQKVASMQEPDDLDQALQARGMRQFQRSARDVRHGLKSTARDIQNQRMGTVADYAMKRDAIRAQAYEKALQAKREQEAARTSFITSILGTGGMVAGAMIGGPAGAGIGQAAGSAVGQGAAYGTKKG